MLIALVEPIDALEITIDHGVVEIVTQVAEFADVRIQQIGFLGVESLEVLRKGAVGPVVIQGHIFVMPIAQRLGNFASSLCIGVSRGDRGTGRAGHGKTQGNECRAPDVCEQAHQ